MKFFIVSLIFLQSLLFGAPLIAGVNSYTSRLLLTNSRQTSNGQALVTVGLEIRDEFGAPISGKSVTLFSSNSSFKIVQPISSDLNGSATGYILSKSSGTGEVWGLVDGVRVDSNLIDNPSGELGNSSVQSWSNYSNQTLSNPDQRFLWETSAGSNTLKSLSMKLSNSSNYSYELSWFQRIQSQDLVAGSTYTLSALIRAGTDYFSPEPLSGLYLSAINEDTNNNPITSTRSVVVSFPGGWNTVIVSSVMVPQGATQVDVSLDCLRSTGTAYFDNVRMMLWPPIEFKVDTVSPTAITSSSPTLLSAVPGSNNGEIIVSWNSSGNDGPLWPNPEGSYEVRITKDFSSLPVSSWTLVNITFSPESPGRKEVLTLTGLTPGSTYQIAVRAIDQSGNKPNFGLTIPVAARSGLSPIKVMSVNSDSSSKSFSPNPTFYGTTQSGAFVKVKIDGDVDGQTYADYSGQWLYKVRSALVEGSHIGSFQAFDSNGNTSSPIEVAFQVGSLRLSKGQTLKFEFSVKSRTKVKIGIFDYQGSEIKLVTDQDYELGVHKVEWDGRKEDGSLAASNGYWSLFETDKEKAIKNFTVLR